MPIDVAKIQQKEERRAKTPKAPDKKMQDLEAQKQTLEEERIYRRGVVTIRDLISPAAFEVSPSFLKLSGLFVRTLFVITYPRYMNLGWSAPIINMNRTFDVAMYFYPVDARVILKQLKKKVGILEAGIYMDADKGKPRDPLRETALRDIESLRDSLTQGIEHFFQFAFYITIYGKKPEDLEKYTQEVESMFG